METKRVSKTSKKDKGLLVSFAQTIGSTLGTMVARTDVLSKPASGRTASRKSGSRASKVHKNNKS